MAFRGGSAQSIPRGGSFTQNTTSFPATRMAGAGDATQGRTFGFHHGGSQFSGMAANAFGLGGDQKPSRCLNCGKPGHRKDQCQEHPREEDDPMKCYNCGQLGHRSSECAAANREKTTGLRTDGRPSPDRYNPKTRDVEDIFQEDDAVKKLYSTIFEDDEQIIINGADSDVSVMAEWNQLPLNPTLRKNIERAGYLQPRKIQAYSIPLIWEGRDLKAQAETGSGKSAAFLIPLVHKICQDKKTTLIKQPNNKPFALIIEPTRELALQVYEQARKLAHMTGVQVVKCYGQYDATNNAEEVMQGCDIIVGTPGRLKHFFLDSTIDPSNLKYFVLDECDRLLEAEDFMDIVRKIRRLRNFPHSIQTLLFSATFTKDIDGLAKEFLKDDHAYIHNKNIVAANSKVAQSVLKCSSNEKKAKVLELLEMDLRNAQAYDPTATQPPTLVFVRSRSDADLMALFLCECGYRATTINGDRPQRQREIALISFRTKKTPILVATDVCARGLDVKDLDYVINMDLPDDIVTYVHRIGRTGRLKQGRATSLFDPDSDSDLKLAQSLVDTLKQSATDVPEFLVKVAKKVPAPPLTTSAFGINSGGSKSFSGGGFSNPIGSAFQPPQGFAPKPFPPKA